MVTPPYRLLMYRGYRGLLCLMCNRFSWNPHDVQHHYCGFCDVWLDDLPEQLRQDLVGGQAPGLQMGQDD
jgi:hypothetical protein